MGREEFFRHRACRSNVLLQALRCQPELIYFEGCFGSMRQNILLFNLVYEYEEKR